MRIVFYIFNSLLVITGSILILGGCTSAGEKVEFVEVVGKYSFHKFDRDLNYDSLVLLSDSSYTQKYLSSQGKTFTNKGTWSFRHDSQEIVFRDFNFFTDEGVQPGSGNWFSKVIKNKKEVRLIYSLEDEEYYRRILPN